MSALSKSLTEGVQAGEAIEFDEEIEEETGIKMSVQLKQIDGHNVYETKEEAEQQAEKMGCSGHHEHKEGDKVWYMPCESHEEITRPQLSDDLGKSIIENLKGETMSNEWVLVDFWAPWCGPCKRVAPFFDKCFESMPKNCHLVIVDVDEGNDIAFKRLHTISIVLTVVVLLSNLSWIIHTFR